MNLVWYQRAQETSPKGVKATGRDVCLKKRVQLPWFLMRKSNNIFITVVPTNERNGGLLKLNRGLSWVQALRPFAIYNKPASFADKAQAKLEQKKVYSHGFPAFYKNFGEDKDRILKENAGKAAIYLITNKVTKKKYIGKSDDLQGRFANYFSKEFLKRNKGSSLIYRNLLRFGFENFSLTILEYCPADDLQNKEQHFINIFMPSLNIRKMVTNSDKSIVSKKNHTAEPKSNSKSQDEIINNLHRRNPDLDEFKKNITIPLEIKEMMDLAESTHNPLGWWYQVDKERNGHFAIWFLNKKTDQAFYGYTAYWKDGEILNLNGFYKLKIQQPKDL